jgi:hypothetical protein
MGRWLRGQRVFVCPECGKRWPRSVIFEVCGGTHLAPHPHRLMVRTRQVYRRDNPVEMAAEALRFDR